MTKREIALDKMHKLGYSQKYVAQNIGISEVTLCNILNGVTDGDNSVVKLLGFLKIDPQEWLSGTNGKGTDYGK